MILPDALKLQRLEKLSESCVIQVNLELPTGALSKLLHGALYHRQRTQPQHGIHACLLPKKIYTYDYSDLILYVETEEDIQNDKRKKFLSSSLVYLVGLTRIRMP